VDQNTIAQIVAAVMAALGEQQPSKPVDRPVSANPVSVAAAQAFAADIQESIVIDPAQAVNKYELIGCGYQGDSCRDSEGRVNRFRPHGVGSLIHKCSSEQGAAVWKRYSTAVRNKDTETKSAIEAKAKAVLGL
jgi:hypothetical protein